LQGTNNKTAIGGPYLRESADKNFEEFEGGEATQETSTLFLIISFK
jgi:hypothetical protein